MSIVLKSGSLSLLEPSGPVQDCNGIALTFTISHAVANRFERGHESVVRQIHVYCCSCLVCVLLAHLYLLYYVRIAVFFFF